MKAKRFIFILSLGALFFALYVARAAFGEPAVSYENAGDILFPALQTGGIRFLGNEGSVPVSGGIYSSDVGMHVLVPSGGQFLIGNLFGISAAGRVGMPTADPSYQFRVSGNLAATGLTMSTDRACPAGFADCDVRTGDVAFDAGKFYGDVSVEGNVQSIPGTFTYGVYFPNGRITYGNPPNGTRHELGYVNPGHLSVWGEAKAGRVSVGERNRRGEGGGSSPALQFWPEAWRGERGVSVEPLATAGSVTLDGDFVYWQHATGSQFGSKPERRGQFIQESVQTMVLQGHSSVLNPEFFSESGGKVTFSCKDGSFVAHSGFYGGPFRCASFGDPSVPGGSEISGYFDEEKYASYVGLPRGNDYRPILPRDSGIVP